MKCDFCGFETDDIVEVERTISIDDLVIGTPQTGDKYTERYCLLCYESNAFAAKARSLGPKAFMYAMNQLLARLDALAGAPVHQPVEEVAAGKSDEPPEDDGEG